MYFKDIEIFDIDKNIENNENIYAHISKNKQKETLKQHLNLVYKYFLKICDKKDINSVFNRLENSFFENSSKYL